MEKRWILLNEKDGDLREVLINNRNIEDEEAFFQPHLYKLTSANKYFPDLDFAVSRIKKAIKEKELIFIYGDFDVDGITATAILWETIDFLGGKVMPYIPHREKEGYGIHAKALRHLAKEGAKLIISVDCGITAVEEAKIAKKLNVDLIITDHHSIQPQIPEPFALLHTDKLSGSGVAFMLAKALLEAFSRGEDEQFYKNLELATIGTIADMVPLVDDNRIIVANGLVNLNTSQRLGLKALLFDAGISKKAGTFEVGFIISPRLNAAGRMESALDSLRLLLTRNKDRADILAKKLTETNKLRQDSLAAALNHARDQVNSNGRSKLIFAHHESYLAGVIGLVAGRLAEEFYRPAIVISQTSPISKGSARSISGFNITQALGEVKKYLINHGGHPMAAGFSIEKDKIDSFKEKIINETENNLKAADLTPTLKIDSLLEPADLNDQTLGLVREFEPFGIGNKEPTFMTKKLGVKSTRRLGNEGKHLRLVLRSEDSRIIDAIGFGLGSRGVGVGDVIDTAYTLNENTWHGDKRLELKIKDFKLSQKK